MVRGAVMLSVTLWNCWWFERLTWKRLVASSAMLQIQNIHSMLYFRFICLIYVLVSKDVMSLKYRKVTCNNYDFQLKSKRFFSEIIESFSIYWTGYSFWLNFYTQWKCPLVLQNHSKSRGPTVRFGEIFTLAFFAGFSENLINLSITCWLTRFEGTNFKVR